MKEMITKYLRYGVDPDTAAAAVTRQAGGNLKLLAVTGKLASGKDTIAEAVMSYWQVKPFHLSFAAALKREMDELMSLMRGAANREEAVSLVSSRGATPEQSARMVELLFDQVRSNPELTARSRTPEIRAALQVWGLDVRRGQDPEYWVKQAVLSAAQAIAKGEHVMITDVRFPDEVRACQAIGFTVVRLEVRPEVQAERLWARDGLLPDPVAINHASETALDGYEGFDLSIDNNGSIPDGVNAVVGWLTSR